MRKKAMATKRRALVITKSALIYKLVSLELSEDLVCDIAGELKDGYDFIIYDYDDKELSIPYGVSIGFTEGADITLPFPIGELKDRLLAPRATLSVDRERLTASLGGRIIRLTELETDLLYNIIKGGCEYTSREELHRLVWGKRATDGALNVYIHYLRRKLECDGERVILSSRQGYKINERYL